MAASLPMQISRDGNRSFSKLTAGVLALAVMSMATGCASRPYPKGGDGQPGMVIFVPFIIANEVALYAIEKKKQTAAEAHEAELLSQVRRFEELKALAVKGDAAMQYELGFCYLHARGATYDAAQAAFWFRKSAEQGFAEAQNDLGLCYFNEIGVKWDKVEACAWWTLAASAHDDARQSLLFAESEAGRRLMAEAFADFKESVRRRAAELRALIGRGAIGREHFRLPPSLKQPKPDEELSFQEASSCIEGHRPLGSHVYDWVQRLSDEQP